jgi:hypothetical protein
MHSTLLYSATISTPASPPSLGSELWNRNNLMSNCVIIVRPIEERSQQAVHRTSGLDTWLVTFASCGHEVLSIQIGQCINVSYSPQPGPQPQTAFGNEIQSTPQLNHHTLENQRNVLMYPIHHNPAHNSRQLSVTKLRLIYTLCAFENSDLHLVAA